MQQRTATRTSQGLDRSSFEKRVGRLIKRVPASLIYFDRQGLIIDVSDAALNVFGYERQDVINYPLSDFLPASEVGDCIASNPAFWKEQDHTLEQVVCQKSGATHRVRATVVIDFDPIDAAVGAMASLEILPPSETANDEHQQESPYGLTPREREVLGAAATGLTSRQIAQMLKISHQTVHKHIGHILMKMKSSSRTDACVRATKEGWLPTSTDAASRGSKARLS